MSTAIAVRAVAPAFEFTPEQRKMILASFLNGASESEAAVLLELARARRLNPITRQIHFVKRWDAERNAYVWASQVGIDGFRTIAERTGLYDGQDEAEFAYDKDGKLFSCKVRVYRKDWGRPAVGIAHYAEYVQKKKDQQPNRMWSEKPHVMLAKCAEAIAFRRGFPEDTSGLYSPEEMPEIDVTPVRGALPAVVAPPPFTSEPPPNREPGDDVEAAEAVTPEAAPSALDKACVAIAEAQTLKDLERVVPRIQLLSKEDQVAARKPYGVRRAELLKTGAK